MNVQIRAAVPEDASGIARVHVDAWRVAYRGLIDQVLLDDLDIGQRAQQWRGLLENAPYGIVVGEVREQIAGWATFGAGRDDGDAHLGELKGLYIHPDEWSTGIGHALIVHVESELCHAGYSEAYLWVLRGNERAIRFYERHGWSADGGEKLEKVADGAALHQLRHRKQLRVGAR